MQNLTQQYIQSVRNAFSTLTGHRNAVINLAKLRAQVVVKLTPEQRVKLDAKVAPIVAKYYGATAKRSQKGGWTFMKGKEQAIHAIKVWQSVWVSGKATASPPKKFPKEVASSTQDQVENSSEDASDDLGDDLGNSGAVIKRDSKAWATFGKSLNRQLDELIANQDRADVRKIMKALFAKLREHSSK